MLCNCGRFVGIVVSLLPACYWCMLPRGVGRSRLKLKTHTTFKLSLKLSNTTVLSLSVSADSDGDRLKSLSRFKNRQVQHSAHLDLRFYCFLDRDTVS